ncbi:hypothetical protein EVAR_23117_1 [Eumeta japonica]|uniref:Uncharacterized protein n=1 Tax=Eumeta variegata TaxID=151549 RepID=A0A4C1VA20_EUMVA|nr:hypothetical protein EVAR_23117_1 [Eumeta japonica]
MCGVDGEKCRQRISAERKIAADDRLWPPKRLGRKLSAAHRKTTPSRTYVTSGRFAPRAFEWGERKARWETAGLAPTPRAKNNRTGDKFQLPPEIKENEFLHFVYPSIALPIMTPVAISCSILIPTPFSISTTVPLLIPNPVRFK